MKIIVTDLTRFSNRDKVCTAGIDVKTGECIRPMPYLKSSDCEKLNILPGAILKGEFKTTVNAEQPHTEDAGYKNLTFEGPCSEQEFHDVLEMSLFESVRDGFELAIPEGQKNIPQDEAPEISIITISIKPSDFEIVPDKFKPGKIKLNFIDSDEVAYRYIPITDLGFFDYAEEEQKSGKGFSSINNFINSQDELFLRIGLSRFYPAPNGASGYWMQANGIYTFPRYLEDIRCYKKHD